MKDEIDYILEILTEIKSKFLRTNLAGLRYDVYLSQVEPDSYWSEEPNIYDQKINALNNLKEVGIIKHYEIEERMDNEIYHVRYAICKIDEDKLDIYLQNNTSISNELDSDNTVIQIGENLFKFNFHTGDFLLNKTRGNFVPKGQEYNFMQKLLVSKQYQATYAELITAVWNGKECSKSSKSDLSLLLKKVKNKLKILPADKSINADIFKNLKGSGYRLAVQDKP